MYPYIHCLPNNSEYLRLLCDLFSSPPLYHELTIKVMIYNDHELTIKVMIYCTHNKGNDV